MSLTNNYDLASISLNRAIAQKKYTKDESCSICLSSMLNKTVLHIPCGHIFHNNCINIVFKSDCLTKYKCPLCRCDNYSALKKLGLPPLQIEEDSDDEHFANAIEIIASIVEIIGSSFSPVCFYNSITNNESELCKICKDNFINLSQTSENVDMGIKTIIDVYNEQPDGIIYLFDDIKSLFNFEGNVDEYMLQIFPDYNNSDNVNPH
jgi:hypothetical protein